MVVSFYMQVLVEHYLQAGALVREGGAEEGGDNAHDGLRHVALQHGVGVLPVTRVVTHLRAQT